MSSLEVEMAENIGPRMFTIEIGDPTLCPPIGLVFDVIGRRTEGSAFVIKQAPSPSRSDRAERALGEVILALDGAERPPAESADAWGDVAVRVAALRECAAGRHSVPVVSDVDWCYGTEKGTCEVCGLGDSEQGRPVPTTAPAGDAEGAEVLRVLLALDEEHLSGRLDVKRSTNGYPLDRAVYAYRDAVGKTS